MVAAKTKMNTTIKVCMDMGAIAFLRKKRNILKPTTNFAWLYKG